MPRNVYINDLLWVGDEFREYVQSRCVLGDEDACFVLNIWGLIGNKVIAFNGDDRVVAITDASDYKIADAIAALRELGIDVHIPSEIMVIWHGLTHVLLRGEPKLRPISHLLSLNGRAVPFALPGFISVHRDGAIRGTVIAPQWFVPKQCYTDINGVLYVRIRGVGTFGVDKLGLLTPATAARVEVGRECDVELPDTVVLSFLDAPETDVVIHYNGFLAYRWINAHMSYWFDDVLREELRAGRVGEPAPEYTHGVGNAVAYRVGINELLGILRSIASARPWSDATKLIDILKAIEWLRSNAKGILSAMAGTNTVIN